MYTHRNKLSILKKLDRPKAKVDKDRPQKQTKRTHKVKKDTNEQQRPKEDARLPEVGDLQVDHNSSLHASAHVGMGVNAIGQKKVEISKLLGVPLLPIDADTADKSLQHHMSDITKMFTRKPHDTLSTAAAHAQFSQPDDVTILDRKWEDKFLHEPTGCERPCVNSASGTCFASTLKTGQVNDRKLTLCEFYVPTAYEQIRAGGWIWPKEVKPCLLCLRAEIYSKFLETRCNANGCAEDVNYATIGNIIGEPGEYDADSCFVSRPDLYEGVLHPVVIPTIHDYQIFVRNGNRHLQQLHAQPECETPSFFF